MAHDDPKPEEDPSTKWAELRTDLAEDRNIMAMERTFAGWMRTAFAAIAVGIGFQALFGEFEPPWLAKAIATMFILAGGWLAVSAERRTCRTLDIWSAMNACPPKPGSTVMTSTISTSGRRSA